MLAQLTSLLITSSVATLEMGNSYAAISLGDAAIHDYSPWGWLDR